MAVVALLAASCSSADDAIANGSKPGDSTSTPTKTVSLTASIGANLRTGMINDGDGYVSFYWHKGDAIGIQIKDAKGNWGYAKFTTDDETGATTATFTGEVPEDYEIQQYAVYPYYELGVEFTGEKSANIWLAPEINYPPIEELIFPTTEDGTTTYPATSTNVTMVGSIADRNITFRHLGGLAVIRVDKMPYIDGSIEITADQNLCGTYPVSDLSADDAQIKATESSNGYPYYQIHFDKATVGSPAVFYLPLATGTYSNLKFDIVQNGKAPISIPYGTLDIGRGEIHAISFTSNAKGALRNIRSLGNHEYLVNGQRFMDLGLESGLLWAETNIGSSSPYLPGDYFAWGETETKSSFTNDNATWASTEYSQATLLAKDDAATASWGSGIRMPTQEEFDKLGSEATRLWKDKYINELKTRKEFFHIYNGTDETRCIYLPVTDIYDGTSLSEAPEAVYWTSTASTTLTNGLRTAYFLDGMQTSTSGSGYSPGKYTLSTQPLYRGCNIRAVADK